MVEYLAEETYEKTYSSPVTFVNNILEENKNDAAKNVTAKKIQANWNTICEIISRLPKVQELETLYKKLGKFFSKFS